MSSIEANGTMDMDDIRRIVQALTEHSLEPECKHSFKEIMESIFD
jgi:hypothetical protein